MKFYTAYQQRLHDLQVSSASEAIMAGRLSNFTIELMELDQMRTALINLKHGQLSIDIIPLDLMNKTIQNIQQYIAQNHIPLRLLRPTPAQIYAQKDFLYFRIGKQIFITVK